MTKIEAFIQKYYNSVLIEVTELIKNKISENREIVIESTKNSFSNYFAELIEIQKNEMPIPISFVHISFLLTSISEHKAKMKIEAYPELGIINNQSIYSKDLEIPYLNEVLHIGKLKLIEYAKKDMVAAFIHESVLEQLVLRMAIAVNIYFFEFYKYYYETFFECEEINNILKCDDLYVTYGEYYDWQRPIFAIRRPLDIFNRDDKDTLNFRTFDNFIYDDKELDKLEIRNSKFLDCKFNSSVIKDCIFIDCTFINCDFKDVKFENSQIIGATFDNCMMKQCDFIKVSFHYHFSENKQTVRLYKELELVDSVMDICSFENCNLTSSKLYECDLRECKFSNTNLELSDFKEDWKEDF